MTIEQKYYHPEIKWYHRFNPLWWFDNIDDPHPPEQFVSKIADWSELRVWLWWKWRNKLHNGNYYVWGLAGKDIEVKSKYPGELFAPIGYNWFLVKYKWLILPGLSYYGNVWRWYIGWLDSGQFGLEFRKR